MGFNLIFAPPFRNAHSSILFINGLIHFSIFIIFLAVYGSTPNINYLYAVICFCLSSLSLIFSSIIGMNSYLINNETINETINENSINRNSYEKI
jgi:uncharacterized membrane protein